jgi:PAS domain S-box-containing protein
MTGRFCYEIWHHRNTPCDNCPVTRTIEKGASFSKELPGLNNTWKFISGHPVRDALGNITGAVNITLDITDRKRAEAEAINSARWYRGLIDASPDAVIATNLDGIILQASRRAFDVYGTENPNDLIGKDCIEFVAQEHRETAFKNYQQTIECGTFRNAEYSMLRKDGRVYSAEVDASLIHSPDGTPEGFIFVIRDVTEKKAAEEAIKQSEENFRSLADHSPNMIFINSGGRIVYANKLCEDAMGYSRDAFYDSDFNFMDLVADEFKDDIRKNFSKHSQGEDVPPFEYVLVSRDGHRINSLISTKIIDFHGKKSILGIVTDITANKKAEADKEKADSQIRQMQKMEAIGRLAGGVAHDFNNLLTAITGYSDIILKTLNDKDPVRADAMEIRKAAERAASLTRQLLTFSRNRPGKLAVVDLNVMITDVQKMLKPMTGEDIIIDFDLAADLHKIKADESAIVQVILNLAVNARDAMPGGGRISISTRNIVIDKFHLRLFPNAKPGKFVCMSFRDTGSGIPAEIRSHIFEPFFTTKEEGKGTGLGLSVVYGIVNQHGGWINFYTETGRGTEFKIYLPAYFTKQAPIPPCSSVTRNRPIQGKGQKILLVEDEESVRIFACRVLQENGYTVLSAATAAEAFDIFTVENGSIDVLFTDIVLPDISGVQLYYNLVEKSPRLKAILTSGYSDERHHTMATDATDYIFLQKPYLIDELLDKLKKII